MTAPERTHGLTLGCWDGLHEGHTNHLRACAEHLARERWEPSRRLVVVAMTDFWLSVGKGVEPLVPQFRRIRALRDYLNALELATSVRAEVWTLDRPRIRMAESRRLGILYTGPDQTWHQTPRNKINLAHCEHVVIPRTEGVSSTALRGAS